MSDDVRPLRDDAFASFPPRWDSRMPRAMVIPNPYGRGWKVNTRFDLPSGTAPNPGVTCPWSFRWKWRAVRYARRWVERERRTIERLATEPIIIRPSSDLKAPSVADRVNG